MTRASILLFLALAAIPAGIDREARDPDTLVVHEWGTFTTVAGEQGEQVEWLPLEGQNDLPCFVERFRFDLKGTIAATVRMETPVLYFYAPRETTVDVSVRFPGGVVTEWFPRAKVTPATARGSVTSATLSAPGFAGTAVWSGVKVRPGTPDHFPTESRASHYYAARRTDAAPVTVGGQVEKFLFYRGVANAPVPVSAVVTPDGSAVISTRQGGRLGTIVRFDRRNGALGYEIREVGGARAAFGTPALTGDLDSLAIQLERILTREGLYQKEARAMVDTWRDSWFEDGTRLLYILPKASVDAMLPLDIRPRPTSVARVFVGRIELFTPATMTAVRTALEARDRAGLLKFGRFLLPISQRVLATPSPALNRKRLDPFIYGTLAELGRGTACAPAAVP